MRVKRNLVRTLLSILIPYVIISLLFYPGFGISFYYLLSISMIMIAMGFFLFVRARKTIHRDRETVFVNVSSVLFFFTIVSLVRRFSTARFDLLFLCGVGLFLIFLLSRDLEFIQKISDVNFILVLLLVSIGKFAVWKYAEPSIIVGGTVLAITFYDRSFTTDFEKSVILEILFSYMVIAVIESILRLASVL